MIFRGKEDCNQDADDAFSVGSVRESLIRVGSDGATGQKGACEVAYRSYDYGEVVAAVPKAIVGCLVTKDLEEFSSFVEFSEQTVRITSMRPTTIDKLGIWNAVSLLLERHSLLVLTYDACWEA